MGEILTKESYDEVSEYVVLQITALLKSKPDALLCLAAGHTSLGIFKKLIFKQSIGEISFKKAKFVGLDEWVGMNRHVKDSCGWFLYKHFFDFIDIPEENIQLFDGCLSDLEDECTEIGNYISQHGGIDFLLLGVGMNGHLALNEPGSSFSSQIRVTKLDMSTKTVGQKYFEDEALLSHGITLGIKNILEARQIVLAVSGGQKANIVSRMLKEPLSPDIPASVLRDCPHAVIVLDRECMPLGRV